MVSRKRRITVRVDDIRPWELEGPLINVQHTIEDYVKKYGSTARLCSERYFEYGDGSDHTRFYIEITRDETDEEMAARVAEEKRLRQQRLDNDREEYERLKKKFEK